MVLTSNTVLLAFILSIYINNKLAECHCWPEDQDQLFSTMEFELRRNARPIVFQLQRNMLKCGKTRSEYLLPNCIGLQTFWMTLVIVYILPPFSATKSYLC